MIQQREKAIHWAEAFGLSALAHVGVVWLLLNTVIDLESLFTPAPAEIEQLQITSLAIETGLPNGDATGSSSSTVATAETLTPVTSQDTILDPVDAASVEADVAQSPAASPEAESTAPTTPERVAPVTAATAPPPVSALRPETQTLAPIQAVPAAPATTAQPVPSLAPVAPVSPTAPVANTPDPAPQQPAAIPSPQLPAEPDPVAADLIARIRDALGETCLIAIPQQSADGAIGLTIYTANETAAPPFADEILADLTPRPSVQTILIDPRQCAALDYIRQATAYPTSPMALSLDATRIASGTDLTGRLTGTGGRNITLLLVDDNGVTQDLGQYLTVAVNTARFAVPLRRAGAARDTQQLLIAYGTPTRPAAATDQNGQVAEDYFTALGSEVGGNAPIILVPFDVQ